MNKSKMISGSLGDMLEDKSENSVIRLILKLNLAVVKNSPAEKKIKNYLLFNSVQEKLSDFSQ